MIDRQWTTSSTPVERNIKYFHRYIPWL